MVRRPVRIIKKLELRLQQFAADEEGTLLAFAAVVLLIMLAIAGMGLDIMRYEQVRTDLQQTLDRSTLAAASFTQTVDAEQVVRDYFAKAGLSDKLTKVKVTKGLNFKTVEAEALADTDPIFMNLIDRQHKIDLDARGKSIAEQRITNVEIMLVLDISGSMAGSKINNLKAAATEFVSTVLSSDAEGRISIGIVPYNGQVNLPQYLQDAYRSKDDHGVANINCFDLPSSVYSGLGLSTTLEMPVTGNVDTYSSTYTSNSFVSPTNSSYSTPYLANRWCMNSTTNIVRAPTNNIAQLQAHINALTAGGATSINAGMKWGMALMDPGSRSVITRMVTQGQTPSGFSGRPYNYMQEETMKVIVLMTDGEHFPEERLNDGYRVGASPIYRSSGDGNYSIYINRANTNNDYWVPHRNEWRSAAWNSGSGVYQITWDELWSRQRMSWVAWQLYARAYNSSQAYYDAMDAFRTKTPVETMNTQLQGVCSRARDNGVIVYGIAFEAPSDGQNQIRNCATSNSHYYDANGLEISTAFRSIASNISQLRLTQ